MNNTKRAVVTASFGTIYRDSCEKTIGNIERALQKSFAPVPVFRAFTGKTVIKIMRNKGDTAIESLSEALMRLKNEGFEEVLVQPTHIMNGPDCEGVKNESMGFGGSFKSIRVSKPLLSDSSDCAFLAKCLAHEMCPYENDGTLIVFAGHGANEEANGIYRELENAFRKLGKKDYFVATLHGEPSLGSIMGALKATGRKNILLAPLMIVAGGHAVKDMAGTWKSVLENEGFGVTCLLKGLGEYDGVTQLIVKHAHECLSR